jgi:hypothetical protein
MKHIKEFTLFEDSDENQLISDLFSVGINSIKWNFGEHGDSWPKMESLVAGEIEEWKGPNSERVKEVNGEIVDNGSLNFYNIELVLTNGGKVKVEESFEVADLGDYITVFYDDVNGREIGIGTIPVNSIEKEERVPQLMRDHVYEASVGYGICLRMLNLYSDYASKK